MTVLLGLGLGLAAGPAWAGGPTTSSDIPPRRAEPVALVRTSTADTLVQVNVDVGMTTAAGSHCRSPYPGACKGPTYHPCFNPDDPEYRDCQAYTVYRVLPPGADLTQGIAIGSAAPSDWGYKLSDVQLEVYARDALREYGDIRLRVDSFPHTFGPARTAYTDEIGHLTLPRAGAPGTGTIVGTASGPGGPMAPRSFKFDAFGRGDTGRRTGPTGTGGFREYGFGSARVEDGVTDGSYRTRPLFSGTYDVHIQRRGASYTCPVTVGTGPVRLDLDFRVARLGHPGCQPLRPLIRTVPG